MLERIAHVSTLDVYGFVTCMRAQRNYMVQTEDQYVFIHDALVTAVTAGNTEILARNLRAHLHRLLVPINNHGTTALQLEFQVSGNVSVQFQVTFHEQLRYTGTLQCYSYSLSHSWTKW